MTRFTHFSKGRIVSLCLGKQVTRKKKVCAAEEGGCQGYGPSFDMMIVPDAANMPPTP